MGTTSAPRIYKPHPEIYRFPPWLLVTVVLAAILIQTSPHLLRFFPFMELLDLPLLVVIYFGFSRRNPSTGLLLGCFVGLLQDALSHQYIGLFGIAKTVVGFLASSLTSRVDTDNATGRAMLIFGFYLLQSTIHAGAESLLPIPETSLFSQKGMLEVLKAALINPIVGVIAFAQFDRVRKIF